MACHANDANDAAGSVQEPVVLLLCHLGDKCVPVTVVIKKLHPYKRIGWLLQIRLLVAVTTACLFLLIRNCRGGTPVGQFLEMFTCLHGANRFNYRVFFFFKV